MTKHTPGPWVIAGSMNDDIRESSRDHCTIATIRCYASHNLATEKDANTRLIATAPELLEALERLVYLRDATFAASETDWTRGMVAARAAIAKARGE